MRPDVKLGIVISAVLVTVGGAYFMLQERRDSAIPVNSDPEKLIDEANKARTASQPAASSTRSADRGRTASPPAARPGANAAARRSTSTASAPNGGLPTNGARNRSGGQSPDRGRPTPQRNASGSPAGRAPVDSTPPGRPATSLAQGRQPSQSQEPRPADAGRPQSKPQLALTGTPAPGDPAAIERHRVQEGDTVASLAAQYYGSTQFSDFLISQNRHLADPANLRPGEIVNIASRSPDRELPISTLSPATRSRPSPASAPTPREYRVKPGDSFYRIARDVLGDAKRWQELYELNKRTVGDDPTKLKIGQVLILPSK